MRALMKHRVVIALWCAGLIMAGSTCLAQDRASILKESDLSAETFERAAKAIRQHLKTSDKRAYSDAERQRIERSLDRIATHLASDRPSAGSRIRREQVRVNEILLPKVTQASTDSEVICRRENRVGSHVSKTVCRTREEMELEREQARAMIDRFGSGNCVSTFSSESGGFECLPDDINNSDF